MDTAKCKKCEDEHEMKAIMVNISEKLKFRALMSCSGCNRKFFIQVGGLDWKERGFSYAMVEEKVRFVLKEILMEQKKIIQEEQ